MGTCAQHRGQVHSPESDNLTIIDPKAHGLGYLYPPKARTSEEEADWPFEAWEALLREALELPRTTPACLLQIDLSIPTRVGMERPSVF
jgi:hypothetical protein